MRIDNNTYFYKFEKIMLFLILLVIMNSCTSLRRNETNIEKYSNEYFTFKYTKDIDVVEFLPNEWS